MSLLIKSFAKSDSRGFTLIEILVGITIMFLLAILAIAALSNLQRQVDIDSTTQSILSTLRLARSQTLGSEGSTAYGVRFATDKYTLFAIDGSVAEKEYKLVDTEILEWDLAGGGVDEVIFQRITGRTDNFGTITISLKSDTSKTAVIKVNPSGQVSLSDDLVTNDTRLIDSRHLRFKLAGWTVADSNTLRLSYPDGNRDYPISIQGGIYDSKQTIKPMVDGSEQKLRVYTVPGNGVLGVVRDWRDNNKALTISIYNNFSWKEIVIYPSSCDPVNSLCATKGNGVQEMEPL